MRKIFFGCILFLTFSGQVHADVLHNLSVPVTPNGDIPSVTIQCIQGHGYTLTFTNNTGSYLIGSVQRLYCAGNSIAFNGLNLNTFLNDRYSFDPGNWFLYVHTPIYYVIKDTTSQGGCDSISCPDYNLPDDQNSFDQFANDATDTTFPTIGAGPVFDTTDHVTWSNTLNGDGTGNYTPPPAGNSSVLFLPGIESSRLYMPSVLTGTSENRLWEPGGDFAPTSGDTDVENLYLDPQGKSINTSVYTRDVLDVAYGTINIYKSFLDELEKMKTVDHSIADYLAVPYDWRLSLDDILNNGTKTGSGDTAQISYLNPSDTPFILSELRRLSQSSQNGKVTIVAHSNGGLVAKALLKRLSDTNDPLLLKIDKVIFVAVPQIGTPAAVAGALHGFDQGIPVKSFQHFLSDNIARGFALNAPMTYDLMPDQDYFGSVNTPIVTFDADLPDWISRYGSTIHDQAGFDTFVTDTYDRVNATSTNVSVPDTLNGSLLSSVQTMHTSLDNWQIPATIPVIEIAGWGIPTTVSGIHYVDSHGTIKAEPTFTVDGDGTVVVSSALWTAGASTTRYWVDMAKWNKILNRLENGHVLPLDHKDVLEIPELVDFIKNITVNNLSTSTQYISTSIPSADSGVRLIYSLHSPLTLNLYDNFGNHTGISTTTGQVEEQIPGTYYVQFGDDKYIFTDNATGNHIIMNGYATGTFTFNVDELSDDTRIASTTFKDIPTSTTTQVTFSMSGDITTASPLLIDTNGDGTTDISLPSKLNAVVTYTKPKIPLTYTVQNATITLGSSIPSFAGSFAGFVDSDTASSSDITGIPQCTTTATLSSPVGTYPIVCTAGTLTSQKYSFGTFTSGTLKILYRFDGFLQPINDTTHQIGQSVSVFKAGSTVPVKFQLKRTDGTIVQAITTPLWLFPQNGGIMNATVDESVYSDPATSGSTFKWDSTGQQYIYNWSTKGFASGYWYKLYVRVDDGSTYFITVGLK